MGRVVCPAVPTVTLLSPQYGEVLNLVLSRKKAGNAIVEFATVRAAVSAIWGLCGTGKSCHSGQEPTFTGLHTACGSSCQSKS